MGLGIVRSGTVGTSNECKSARLLIDECGTTPDLWLTILIFSLELHHANKSEVRGFTLGCVRDNTLEILFRSGKDLVSVFVVFGIGDIGHPVQKFHYGNLHLDMTTFYTRVSTEGEFVRNSGSAKSAGHDYKWVF
jgi:hypothetical protein